MGDLARKLAGLRREAGVAAQIPRLLAAAPPVIPTIDPAARLRRLLATRPSQAASPTVPIDRALVGEEIAPGLRYVEQRVPADVPAVMDLGELGFPAVATPSLLAFDTETTGLAGGTGTRAFMIGAANWEDGQLRTRQLYITTLAAEQAMLREFLRWVVDGTVLVSYNGKCYDRPLLSTRLRLARLPDPLLGRGHLDLLHPVRRRFRGVWPNCKLATAERELLAVLRDDDLPGAEAPGAWLGYLRGGSTDRLRRVVDHNRQDLRSLAGLLRLFTR